MTAVVLSKLPHYAVNKANALTEMERWGVDTSEFAEHASEATIIDTYAVLEDLLEKCPDAVFLLRERRDNH